MATSAERMLRHCDRKRRGVLAVVTVELEEPVVRALISKGWLDYRRDQSGDIQVSKATFPDALGEMLSEWARNVVS